MIIRCNEPNRKEVLEYARKDTVMNLFIIGDIENFGFDNPWQSVFMDKQDGSIRTIYLVYRTNLVIGSIEGMVDQPFVEKLVEKYRITDINGDYSIIKKLDIGGFKMDKCRIAILDNLAVAMDSRACELEEGDLKELVEECGIVFKREMDLDQEIENYKQGASRYYGVKEDGRLVSGARTSAHCLGAAMIIGVYTIEQYRNKGYAMATVYKLCQDFLEQDMKQDMCADPYELYHKL